MKSYRVHILLIVLLTQAFSPALAQGVSQKSYHLFNIAILNVLDEYERTSSFSERNDRYSFLQLFADTESPCIYNDLIGSEGFQQSITPQSYVNNVPEDGSLLVRSVMSNVRKEGEIFEQNGQLHRKISFSKYIMIIDASVYTEGEGGVLFDSSQVFDEEPDFRLIMDLSYDPSQNKCYISEILPMERKESSPLDDSRFSVITRSSDKYDKYLNSRGEPLSFNDFNQSLAYYNDIGFDNPDVYAEPVEYASGNRYNVLGFRFRPMYFRFKAYGDMTIGGAYRVSSLNDLILSSSRAAHIGADLGFEMSMNRTWRVGLYAGLGFSFGKIDLSVKDIQYSLVYFGKPIREYSFSASESVNLADIFFPVYLENEFSLSRNLVLDIDLGARVYVNNKTSLSPYRVKGEIGMVSVDKSFTAFVNPATYNRTVYDVVLFGNFELDYCLIERLLYLYLSYGYERGLNPSYNSGLNPYFSPNDKVYPFYYSPIAAEDYPFRSLIGSVSYQRQSGWLSAGVKLKF